MTGNAQWAVCTATSGGASHEFQLKLDSVETSSVNVYDVIVYVTDSSGVLYETATQSNYTLSEGGTMSFSDGDDSYFQVVAGTDAHGNMTLAIQNGYFSYDGLMTSCTAHVMSPTAAASGVGLLGEPWIGSALTGYYTFSDTAGLSESGSTYQWYRVSGGTPTAISGATGTTYTVSSADLGDTLEFCVTPADANGRGVQVCSSPTSTSAAYSAVASNVAISGNPYPGSTLTGSYTFSDGDHLSETSVAYQWYTVSGSTMTAISGATSATFSPTTYDVNDELELCVTPSDAFGPGAEACSSTVTVPGVVWYSGESWTGTAIGETSANGTCVTVSALDLGFTPASHEVRLPGPRCPTATTISSPGTGPAGRTHGDPSPSLFVRRSRIGLRLLFRGPWVQSAVGGYPAGAVGLSGRAIPTTVEVTTMMKRTVGSMVGVVVAGLLSSGCSGSSKGKPSAGGGGASSTTSASTGGSGAGGAGSSSSSSSTYGSVGRVPKAGGLVLTLADHQAHPAGLAVDATYVYWANVGSGSLPDGAIRSVAK